MTLTNRLLLFHTGSHILLLAGFSIAIYFVAHHHLYHQAELRLSAAMNTLGAAVEIGEDFVEWEPQERPIHLESGSHPIVWCVTDTTNHRVACSDNTGSQEDIADLIQVAQASDQYLNQWTWRKSTWQVGHRLYMPAGKLSSRHRVDPQVPQYSGLAITVAVALAPTEQILRQLIVTLTVIAIAILVVAIIAGRFVTRTAIAPLQKMAEDVRLIDPGDSMQRLDAPPGGDELTRLGLAFNDLLERLHDYSDRHRRFAGDASHQLRTPLAAILGQIEIALRRERSPQEYQETLATVQFKSMQLHRIVEMLLWLTRTGSDAGLPQNETVDLDKWLTAYLKQWESHNRYPDMHIQCWGSTDSIVTQAVLLNEVLNILLDNACHYSAPGTPIVVSHNRTDSWVKIGIRDFGQGIATDDQRQLFQPFFRTTESLKANRQGVGLGLSIARRLVQALGGDITVSSEPHLGSTFTVVLPGCQQSVHGD